MNGTLEIEWASKQSGYDRAIALQLENVGSRLSRLMDAYLDETIDRSLFEEKKLALLKERKALEEQRSQMALGEQTVTPSISGFLELVYSLRLSYEIGTVLEKRDLLKIATSNLTAQEKNVAVELRSPFRDVAKLVSVPTGAPVRRRPRTKMKEMFELVVQHFTTQAESRQPND